MVSPLRAKWRSYNKLTRRAAFRSAAQLQAIKSAEAAIPDMQSLATPTGNIASYAYILQATFPLYSKFKMGTIGQYLSLIYAYAFIFNHGARTGHEAHRHLCLPLRAAGRSSP